MSELERSGGGLPKQVDFDRLRHLSADIRIETIKELAEFGLGHIGGSMSIVDILAVLYGSLMKIDPANPQWEDRDWLVLSKGHCGPALYATLGVMGYFPREVLKTLNQPGTTLPSHCDRLKTPGIDMTTGSLGQGISAALGIAIGNRMKGKDSTVFCIIGDGESQEGQVWEAVQCAAHQKLDNFVVLLDDNKKQIDGATVDVCNPFDMEEKFSAFGWTAFRTDGHDVQALHETIMKAKAVEGQPAVVICETVKGLGCLFAERASFNHYMNIDWNMANEAIAEIESRLALGTYPGGGAQ